MKTHRLAQCVLAVAVCGASGAGLCAQEPNCDQRGKGTDLVLVWIAGRWLLSIGATGSARFHPSRDSDWSRSPWLLRS